MAADLNMPLEIIICPTVRRPDGLAISSRNQYLTEKEKKDAALIYKSLLKCRDLTAKGVKDSQEIISRMRDILRRIPSVTIHLKMFNRLRAKCWQRSLLRSAQPV
jgi:pantothenate synthetase